MMELLVSGETAYCYTGGRPFHGHAPSFPPAAPVHAAGPAASAPVVVFIHGAGQDHSCWNLQSRWFAHHGFAVLAPDLPGHGRSGGTPPASIEAAADWIVALLDAAGVAHATLIGHSMGSLIALDVATRAAPWRISRLALLGCSLPMPVSDGLIAAARDDEPAAWQMINDWSHSPRAHFGGNTVPGAWMLGANRQLMARQRPGVLLAGLDACRRYQADATPASPPLTSLACPVLVIAGAADRMTPARATRELVARLPGAQLTTLPGAGHSLMAEQPDAVLDTLRGFIAH
ncbi:alpha/beta fold hydrolase [Rhodocyclus tenuis]|uniref:alpha/beta fold hydrolase n=1 Tax=Rhodocyclus tenuis TaxID=1066 RepID=UPI001F5BF345|nr:alpha/beta fold hydrolase [Rhodocyclus tenuis]